MAKKTTDDKHFFQEIIFQLLLHLTVFLFYAVVAAIVINYFLLPRFYYRKKYFLFTLFFILILGFVILAEELILEPLFFTGKRADSFGGILLTLSDILPVIVILSGCKFAWDALSKQREVDALKSAVKESELQFLKSQINPHFLFNNLNNLYSYAIDNSPKTPDIILKLSGVLRYMLYECKEKYVLLTKEIKQLENFCRLSELQIEERGDVKFSTENIQSNYKIAPLILMVFIENAFKYSTASQSEGIFIDISIKLSEAGILSFICQNSFQSTSNTDNLAKGIGLANVQKRLQLIYPDKHELKIESLADKYEVNLKIDLSKTIEV